MYCLSSLKSTYVQHFVSVVRPRLLIFFPVTLSFTSFDIYNLIHYGSEIFAFLLKNACENRSSTWELSSDMVAHEVLKNQESKNDKIV